MQPGHKTQGAVIPLFFASAESLFPWLRQDLTIPLCLTRRQTGVWRPSSSAYGLEWAMRPMLRVSRPAARPAAKTPQTAYT